MDGSRLFFLPGWYRSGNVANWCAFFLPGKGGPTPAGRGSIIQLLRGETERKESRLLCSVRSFKDSSMVLKRNGPIRQTWFRPPSSITRISATLSVTKWLVRRSGADWHFYHAR